MTNVFSIYISRRFRLLTNILYYHHQVMTAMGNTFGDAFRAPQIRVRTFT